jgi:hypothetical protein
MNWAEWFLAANACDRALGQSATKRASALGTQTQPQVPDGDWYKHFGSFKICGRGSYPKTFLLPGQPAKGEAL